MVVLTFSTVAYITVFSSREASSGKDPSITISTPPSSEASVRTEAGPEENLPAVNLDVSEVTVKGNDTFYSIMASFHVPAKEILSMARTADEFYDLRRLNKGDTLKVVTRDGVVQGAEYRYGEVEGIRLRRSEGGFTASAFEVPHHTAQTFAYGTIETSLFDAGVRAGADPGVILSLSDIFAWDVDFATDIRKGDDFGLLYETLYVEEAPVRSGRMLGAELVNAGKKFTAVYFKDEKGRGGYYDLKGKSLERTLLKSPLRYRRISSHFSKGRYHPILKKYRPHHGVDYAAPTGTPIESSGDGKVLFAGWKKGYGKYIVIRHNATYTTAYGHLSRIKKGIRKGKRVRQGQVIGNVGSTGLSTGPHLHYEVKVRGKQVNPLKVKTSARRSLTKKEMDSFAALRDEVVEKLSRKEAVLASVASPKTPLN